MLLSVSWLETESTVALYRVRHWQLSKGRVNVMNDHLVMGHVLGWKRSFKSLSWSHCYGQFDSGINQVADVSCWITPLCLALLFLLFEGRIAWITVCSNQMKIQLLAIKNANTVLFYNLATSGHLYRKKLIDPRWKRWRIRPTATRLYGIKSPQWGLYCALSTSSTRFYTFMYTIMISSNTNT